jgi:hypothetical protein
MPVNLSVGNLAHFFPPSRKVFAGFLFSRLTFLPALLARNTPFLAKNEKEIFPERCY